MEPSCYLNGRSVPLSKANVSVSDLGLLRGFGVYEALATYGRRPFRLADHLERLRASAAALSLTVPVGDADIAQAITELVGRNVAPGSEAAIKCILTGGEAIGGIEYDSTSPTFYILVEPLTPLPPETYAAGCGVIVEEVARQLPEFKTTNYIHAVMLQGKRKRAGALEILYVHDGFAFECATSNFFVVREGKIVTPVEGVLHGITRAVVLAVAREEFPIEERPLSMEEVRGADEAFLTSSFKDVVPVVRVGDRAIGEGAPGPVTLRVMELFRRETRVAEAALPQALAAASAR